MSEKVRLTDAQRDLLLRMAGAELRGQPVQTHHSRQTHAALMRRGLARGLRLTKRGLEVARVEAPSLFDRRDGGA